MYILSFHKKRYFQKCLLFLLLPFSFISNAQNVINEYSNFECSRAKIIAIPFPETKSALNNKAALSLHETVFYEHRDQFSYWYKVIIHEDQLIDCKISPVNDKDSYALYIYKYGNDDFCNKIFYEKIKPLKSSTYMNNADNKEAFELSEIKLKVKKNEAYYFCVLNTSPSNCGHSLRVIAGDDTLTVKAIHFPCSEDEIETKPVVNKTQQKPAEVLTKAAKKHTLETIVLHVKDENNKNKKVDARVIIKDELTGSELKIEPTGQNSYTLEIEKGKKYNVECNATGYKKFDHSIVISEYVNPDSGRFDVFLRALQAGDNFVMDNIYFYPNTYALKKGADKEINYLLNYLINNPDVKIELQGHTNGSNRISKNRAYKGKGPEWNFRGNTKKLSRYRAESIKNYLVSKGIDGNRISTTGFGGEKMIVANPKSIKDIEKNVRVEVMIL